MPTLQEKEGQGGNQRYHAPQGMFYQPMPAPQYIVQQPFYPHPQGGYRVGRGSCSEATHPTLSSKSLLNHTQTYVLASFHPGQKQKIVSETPLDYFYPHAPPWGEKTLSALSLPEKEKASTFTIPSG